MSLAARTAMFVVFTAGLLLGRSEVVAALIGFSRGDSSASHLVLVPFVALWLVYQARSAVFSRVAFEWRLGVAVVAVGLVAAGAGALARPHSEHAWLVVSVASVVATWIGGFLLFYGRTAFRAAGFPLFFLCFTVPIPAPLLATAVEVLKRGSTEAVAGLFTIIGMQYHREAYVFALPNLTIEVADACSGIRSSIALFLTALLAGNRLLSRGWSRTLLVLAIVPVTIFKNAIRIVALSWLAINVDPAFLAGRLHTDGGAAFFVLALLLLLPIVKVLRQAEHRKAVQPVGSTTRDDTLARVPLG